jgi:hypothetical protein
LDPDYSRISAPTLLLAGGDNLISSSPPERSIALQELIGENAWVKVVDGDSPSVFGGVC